MDAYEARRRTDQAQPPAGQLNCPALRFRDPCGEEKCIALVQGQPRLLIGRGDNCDVVIDDILVSREHAILELIGTHWFLSDDGMSKNGTYINRQRVVGRRRLEPDDRLLVGGTLLTFRGPVGVGRERPPTQSKPKPLVVLTPAQERVLRALCAPLVHDSEAIPPSNRSLAEELYISEETVKDHLQDLFVRFQVNHLKPHEKRIKLARRALSTGQI